MIAQDVVVSIVDIRRVCKVTQGGKKFSIAALVVVFDPTTKKVGWGLGKANEAPSAKEKAVRSAKRRMIKVPIKEGRTLHYDVHGSFGSSKVVMRKAKPGTGIIAGGAARLVISYLFRDIVVKFNSRSSNPHNTLKAVFNALESISSPRSIAKRRGVDLSSFVYKNKS